MFDPSLVDPASLQVLQALVLIVAGALFILDTASRRNNVAARLWSFAYITGFVTTLSYVIFALDPSAWWANGIGNGLFAASLGMLWAGLRVHNRRRVHPVLVPGVTIVTAASTLVYGASATTWTSAPIVFGGVALFSALIGVECLRTRRANRVSVQFMAFGFLVVALYYVARIAAIMTVGPEHPAFDDYFSSGPASVLTILLTIIWTTGLSVIRAEDDATNAARPATTGSATCPLDPDTFELLAADTLTRADYLQQGFCLIEVRMDTLAEMNTAFGRAFGDDALARLAAVLRTTVPAEATIGSAGAGRFSVLLPAATRDDAVQVLMDVRESMLGESLNGDGSLHLSAALGWAHTDLVGFALSDLRDAAADGLRRD